MIRAAAAPTDHRKYRVGRNIIAAGHIRGKGEQIGPEVAQKRKIPDVGESKQKAGTDTPDEQIADRGVGQDRKQYQQQRRRDQHA